ncbi:hypothetical protein D2E26_1005 [Bifidobacterium dolichotidis]|uniref:Uncharacterized protein n=1 Tax=Bifidobacterium dolichotidis TaxID=2306976 RepID=A0A430FQ48_9BIFI|nr:hypothetical protein [Bifidobacterium dolichotidis]RSX54951.1 hypothetical protein D2E26_1005 [Bifidobacterium dolichotidis]
MHTNACSRAIELATWRTNLANDTVATPEFARFVAADQAEHDWIDVAIQCPTRFEEGTLRSAQMQFLAQSSAQRHGRNYTALTVTRLDDLKKNVLPGQTLAKLALAEDRAGFATEVLAGKRAVAQQINGANGSNRLNALSDDHKQAASELMQLAGNTQDLRRKVYSVHELEAHPDSIVDPATGLRANTVAVLEMNCARDEVAAVQKTITQHTAATQSGESDAQTEQQAQDRNDELCKLALLFATHAVTAFSLGYPGTDWALFKNA